MRGIVGTELISKHKYGYQINTEGNSKTRKYYGFGRTLIEALMIRDWGMNNEWKPFPKPTNSKTNERYIHKIHRGYAIIKSVNGKLQYFGIFDKLEDAILERDLLEKYNWDLELVCECSNEGISFLSGIKSQKSTFTKHDARLDYIDEKMWNNAKYDKLYAGGLD